LEPVPESRRGLTGLTTAGLKEGPQYILDGTLEDDTLALHFDGLKRVAGQSRLGDFHYLPILFHEGRQVKKEQKLLLDVYGMILSGLQGRTPAYGVIWHGRECKATKVKQGDALVIDQIHDMALPLLADQFESQEGPQGLLGWDHLRAG
jgi:hypothetical protein